ncbi:MAG: putative Signal peptide peptidase SppA [Phycisphaerales bacterium]|nr:putative Signal peptide peptidase SppA [Phycisphaerales bacterium]MDB5354071.1 putative Signal peptide peptidase SppA [Phycisphaerales bacterium]
MRVSHFSPTRLLPLVALMLLPGCGTPSFLITPVANTNELNETEVAPGKGWSPGKIAIIEVEGMLVNAKTGGLLQATENTLSLFTQEMERAEKDPSVKAVVLRVNSPGGTVSASDAMYQIVRRFKKKTNKTVVASIQEVGASGAYYVSCAADKIVAQPTSIVGSIGVIFESMEFSGTLDKVGAHAWAITSGPLKEMGSPFKPLEPRERAVMQDMVDEYFTRFVEVVRSNRTLNEQVVVNLAEYKRPDYAGDFSGRIFSGEEGKRRGLVDETGLLSDAIDLAKNLSKSPNANVIMYKRPFGYSGSIYATSAAPPPKANVTTIDIPGAAGFIPAGFYYLWRPGI